MLLTLIRDTFTPAETLGQLLIDGIPFCATLEPSVVPNAQHPKGAIPLGWYRLSVTRSPKFGRLLPILHLVPGFDGIRIHAGNNRDHTAGCILVGECCATAPVLSRSKQTEQSLVNQLIQAQTANEPLFINITDVERYPSERDALSVLPNNADYFGISTQPCHDSFSA